MFTLLTIQLSIANFFKNFQVFLNLFGGSIINFIILFFLDEQNLMSQHVAFDLSILENFFSNINLFF